MTIKRKWGQSWLSQPLGDQFIHFCLRPQISVNRPCWTYRSHKTFQASAEDALHQVLVQKGGTKLEGV